MPAATLRCDNPACAHHGRDRVVEYEAAGDGFLRPISLLCECGHQPRQLDRFHPTPRHPGPERAVKGAPERRTRKGT